MEQIINQVMPYVITVIVAGLTYLASYIQTRRLRNKVISIEEAISNSDDDYYIICPHCNNKVDLKATKIYIRAKTEKEHEESEED